MKKIGLVASTVAFSVLLSCTSSGGSGGYSGNTTGPVDNTCPANTLCMRASIFQPTSLTVAKGAAVSFQNNSTVEHNVVFDSPPPGVTDIGDIMSGTVTRTFGTTGTFALHCTIHAGMTASITVQ